MSNSDKVRRFLPSFLVVGTYRAGTTWIQNVFYHHPEIFVPYEKELFYFSHNYNRGLGWYLAFYENSGLYKAIGEVCPAYLANFDAPGRIKSLLGDVKIITVLRNPFEQIISMYKHHVIRGEVSKSFEDAVKSNNHYLNNIRYAKHLRHYYQNHSKDNILVLLFDELMEDKTRFLQKIYSFLNVAYFFKEDFEKEKNKSGFSRMKLLDNLISKSGDFLRQNNLYFLKTAIKKTGFVDFIKRSNRIESHNGTGDLIPGHFQGFFPGQCQGFPPSH
jgi:hypothetical protein